MELTEPAVTVTMVDGRLEADHENRVELALEAWNTRSMKPMEAGECVRTLTGHEYVVHGATATSDGTIITSSDDGTIKLWDSATGQCIRTMTHGGQLLCVAVSPDGATIASGGDDISIKLWDAATGRQTQTLSGHDNSARCLAFSSDGRTLVSGSYDKTAKVWDVETGQCRLIFTGHSREVIGVAISPDGSTICTGSWDSKVKQWIATTGECIRTMDHGSGVITIAVSPDGAIIASGDNVGSIKFWDSATGELTRTLIGHTDIVWSLAFSPDGRTLVSGAGDNTIMQWDVATGALIRTFSGHNHTVDGVAFSRDGTTIVSGSSDTTAKVWSALTRTPQFLATVNQLCSSPVTPDADITVDPDDSEVLISDTARILLHFLATGLPRSFTMTLTRPAARVWLEDKFAKIDSKDAELAKLIKLFNECRCDQIVTDFCSGAVSTLQVASRVASSQVAPRDLRIAMADPISSMIRMAGGLFVAEGPHNDAVDAITSLANCNARLRVELSEASTELSWARTKLSDARTTISSLQAMVTFAAADQAAGLSATLEGHPLLSVAMPTPDTDDTPSPAGLISRLGQARRHPETRIIEYEAVIAQARAGVEALEARIAAVSAAYQAASAIVDGAAAFESLPSLDEMARMLEAADNEVVDFPTLAPELQARYATLRAFLQPAVRVTWQCALSRKELGEDTSAEERTIRQLTGLAAEAEVHLAGFAEADAITAQLRSLGDYQT
ncbi:WD domain, G-beta repeat [Carpediemonas membranifera]|uniref:WD domain, G-beta repeat n=1 Tax=Carpediemonas membranifera TaxID=201153 RepID=A0A8J6EBK4_9EUKA|nr:WD domain, G-beta repeat [Carpediemonas membranifera]|eukprot:KAG9397495.1 WD domain, G-beta repeat [Carpediemonas membranifera]